MRSKQIISRCGGGEHTRVVESKSRVTVPCFAQRTFNMAELGAERDGMRSCLEGFASVKTEVLVESSKEEVFFWD
jgi:hypothetical protein